ncbi:MAG: TonB-dependent receptor, partial [Bacteroidales bacterium]|jgi:hypothetical protein|nr:TonB-dependent receptor [Bacteroidales bacterium]
LFSSGINWENNLLHNGRGEAYGLEFMASKKRGSMQAWISYTYSKSERQFAELNSGEPFLFKYDRPHSFNMNVSYAFSNKLSISATWIYQTGLPITISDGYIQSPDFNYYTEEAPFYSPNRPYRIETFSEINNLRMRDYHRLDIGLQSSKEKKKGMRTWSFSIYNIYNRQNPYYYYWKYEDNEGITNRKLYQKSLFPILPSVSYSFEF